MLNTSTFFAKKLITWYLDNKRDMPWRETTNPYYIWLSEVILQQTRVAQGLPYYLSFIRAYPTIHDLAKASEDDVLKRWQGLGYYSRARNLHASAKYVSGELNGVFPTTYKDLMALKGVGDYTASAIASICYNEPTAVVDGNVYRVLARVFQIDTPINSTAGAKEFKKLAQELIDTSQAGTFNQAVMEFGARHCTPQNPDCENCVLNTHCMAYKNNTVAQLPVKIKAAKVKSRYFNYMVLVSEDNKTLLNQRMGKGIWQKLFEFPLIETTSEVNLEELQQIEAFQKFSENHPIESISVYNEDLIIHKLSHQHLNTRFWICSLSEAFPKGIPIKEVQEYAVPVLIADFVSEFF